MNRSPRGLFITGTDTNVGKTYVACALARHFVRRGLRVGVYKPAASGCDEVDGQLVSTDAVALWEAAGRPGTLAEVCPQRFAAPLAPHLAARAAGQEIDARQLRAGVETWLARSDLVLVEGAGGYLSPLGDDEYVADLAHDLGFPLLIVAPNVLGVINQTLQTVFTASQYRGGLPVWGVILNEAHRPDAARDPSVLSNAHEIARRASVPLLARLGWQATEFDRELPAPPNCA